MLMTNKKLLILNIHSMLLLKLIVQNITNSLGVDFRGGMSS